MEKQGMLLLPWIFSFGSWKSNEKTYVYPPCTNELAHLEMVATIVHQLTANLSVEEIENSSFAPYYIDHTVGIWPQSAGGVPFTANEFQSTGDPITDLYESMAAEQKARTTYDNILRVVKDMPEIADPIRFLRQREIIHFQRFGEALRSVQDQLDSRNFYAFNPSFDAPTPCFCPEPREDNRMQERSDSCGCKS